MTIDRIAPWLRDDAEGWFAVAEEWIEEVHRERGLGPLASVERVKLRPWSVVLRTRSRGAVAYFKAAGAGGAHEPALLRWLQDGWPALVPALIDVHASEPWMLMEDAGTPLRDVAAERERLTALERFLSTYAEIQIASAARLDEVLATGLPDRRLESLPGALRELIADRSGADVLGDRAPAIRALLPDLERSCGALARSPYAAALDHGDLHPGNLLVCEEKARLCDWGDASVTHPFCSLFATFQMVLGDFADPERASPARILRDAYLEPWTRLASRESLRSDFALAQRVAHAVRILDWAHMLRGADAASLHEWRPRVAEDLFARWKPMS